jgi:hypothetical protein
MKSKFLSLWAIAVVSVVLLSASCDSFTIRWGRKPPPVPPPHAPAHGHRHKYQGWELVYDSGRGVYVLIGLPKHYYYKGYFYRYERPYWQVSPRMAGPWRPVLKESLPPGLGGKEKGKGKSKEPPGRALGTRKKR